MLITVMWNTQARQSTWWKNPPCGGKTSTQVIRPKGHGRWSPRAVDNLTGRNIPHSRRQAHHTLCGCSFSLPLWVGTSGGSRSPPEVRAAGLQCSKVVSWWQWGDVLAKKLEKPNTRFGAYFPLNWQVNGTQTEPSFQGLHDLLGIHERYITSYYV